VEGHATCCAGIVGKVLGRMILSTGYWYSGVWKY
jgi:hypothetical protein